MLQFAYRPSPPEARGGITGAPDWIGYWPISKRPRLRWPNDARIALWVCPNILHYEYAPPENPWLDSYARMKAPDVMAYGRQDYGPRVGFWRLLEVLDRHRVRCTAVVNSEALQRYPDICRAAVERHWDFLGHGECNTRFTFGLSPSEELVYYQRQIADVLELTGVRMAGMAGPGPQSATASTPDILAAAGVTYYADFFCDDQPFPIRVRSGRLISLPYSIEINDPPFLGTAFEADQFCDAIKRQFDVLYREGADSGRIMCISLHAYLLGQPHRIGFLDAALKYVMSFPGVWQATGAEIASWYMTHCYEEAVRSVQALSGAGRV